MLQTGGQIVEKPDRTAEINVGVSGHCKPLERSKINAAMGVIVLLQPISRFGLAIK
jgi:hypothetical protein